MLTAIIGIIAFVALFASASDGNWGSFAIGAVIVAVLILMSAGERKDVRAWQNCRDYWADGGPRRRR